ncbi:MAG: TniB family NTP-binding protein [Acidobacteria bacterium]|nr:TniB family NTP-binding protein [Acidobacteriota bacterium]
MKDPLTYSHLGGLAQPLMAQDDETRIQFVQEDRWIPYPTALRVLDRVKELVESPYVARPECMLLVAPANHGKTRVLKRVAMMHPSVERSDGCGSTIPVAYVVAPPTPHEARFLANILRAINAPFRETYSIRQMESTLEKVVQTIGLKVLCVDEVHHSIAGGSKNHHQFLNVLKNLTNTLGVSIVGAGVPKAQNAILIDEQMIDRFEPWELPLWEPNEQFQGFLAGLESVLPLKHPSGLVEPELAGLIHNLCSGRTGRVTKLMRRATIHAIRTKRERIDAKVIGGCGYDPSNLATADLPDPETPSPIAIPAA